VQAYSGPSGRLAAFINCHGDIGKRVGKSREYVSNSVRLLSLPEYMQQAIVNHEMSEAARGRALSVFASSLNTPGDPNRDPRVAIANATSEMQ